MIHDFSSAAAARRRKRRRALRAASVRAAQCRVLKRAASCCRCWRFRCRRERCAITSRVGARSRCHSHARAHRCRRHDVMLVRASRHGMRYF